jgi:hypothetical protein
VAFAFLGGSLGLFLGLAGGLAQRSSASALTAGLIGLVLGAALGACLPLLLVVPYFHLQKIRNSDDLLVPLAMHAMIWGTLGAIGGLAFGIGLGPGHRLRSLLFAFVGACMGTALFEVIGAVIDPLALTSDPVSKTLRTRLLARMLVALAVGIAICLSVRSSRPVPGTIGTPKPAPVPAQS